MSYRWSTGERSPTHVPPISAVHPVWSKIYTITTALQNHCTHTRYEKNKPTGEPRSTEHKLKLHLAYTPSQTSSEAPSSPALKSTNPTSLNTSLSPASCRRCQTSNEFQILFIYTSGSFYPKLLTLYSDSAFDQVLHSLGIMTLALAAQRRALLVELQQHTIVHSALWNALLTSYFTSTDGNMNAACLCKTNYGWLVISALLCSK